MYSTRRNMTMLPRASALRPGQSCESSRALRCPPVRGAIARAAAVLEPQDAGSELARACGIETAAIPGQGRDDRGLILTRDVDRKRAVARIPLRNVLLVTDEPSEKLSIFGAVSAGCTPGV